MFNYLYDKILEMRWILLNILYKKEPGIVYLEREDFANEMKEDFKGNIPLLKVIEEGMNRNMPKSKHVSLIDYNEENP